MKISSFVHFPSVHSIGTATEEELINAQHAPRDELGVKTVNILYNFEVGTIYCLLDAPNKEAVRIHHDKIGVKSEWIIGVRLHSEREQCAPDPTTEKKIRAI